SSLLDDTYFLDRATHSLTGHREGNRFRLGDMVRVAIARVDIDRRQLDFRLVKMLPRPKRPAITTASVDGEQPTGASRPRKSTGQAGRGKGKGKRSKKSSS